MEVQKLKEEGYVWEQTEREIIIKFIVSKEILKRNLKVQIEANTIQAKVNDTELIIEGKLYANIKKEKSDYKLEWIVNKHLNEEYQQCKITLVKDVEGSKWPLVITSGIKLGQEADPKSIFLFAQLTEGVLPDKTMELYKKSAEKGYLLAQLRLGDIFELGNKEMKKESDKEEALKWFQLAAEKNSLRALFYCTSYYFKSDSKLSLHYALITFNLLKEKIIEPKHIEKFDAYGEPVVISEEFKAKNEGKLMELKIYINTCFIIATLFLEGKNGLHSDPIKALFYWKKASLYNHAPSCYELALLYKQGLGTTQNLYLAATYFYKAFDIDPNFLVPNDTIPREQLNFVKKTQLDDEIIKENVIATDSPIAKDIPNNQSTSNNSMRWVIGLSAVAVLSIAFITLRNKQR
ncbi:HCP-like protein [Neoconidiobolus thromboides FSU 785]|nr:HCP-like protein [Neoconidiobolus thromboides FSU 785]